MDRQTSSSPVSRLGRAFGWRARPAAARRKPRTSLCLEALEDRLCPSTTVYWTGADSKVSDNWSDTGNWRNGITPGVGDDVVFMATGTKHSNNNLPFSQCSFNTMTINGTGYDITGGAVQLASKLENADGINTVGLDIDLSGSVNFTADQGTTLIVNGNIANHGNLVTAVANGFVIFQNGTISGTGGFDVEGSTRCYLDDTNSYTGMTTVTTHAVTLYLGAQNGDAIVGDLTIGYAVGINEADVVRLSLPGQISTTSTVTILDTGLLDLDGYNDTIGALTMTGGNVTTGADLNQAGQDATLTVLGNITAHASPNPALITSGGSNFTGTPGNLALTTGAFNIADSSGGLDLRVTVNIVDGTAATLVKQGQGAMELAGDNSYTGPTEVTQGTLMISATDALGTSAPATVSASATLEYIDHNSGTTLDFAATPLVLDGGTLEAAGAGVTVALSAPVTLNGTSTIEAGFDDTLDLTGPISGKAGFTEDLGGQLNLGGVDHYQGATEVAAGTLVLDTAAALAGSGITVDAGGVLQLAAGQSYAPEQLILSGFGGSLGAALYAEGSATWSGAIDLAASSAIAASCTLTLSGPIGGPATSNLLVGIPGQVGGTVLLTDANTYAGNTEVRGTLAIANAQALGAANKNVTIDPGATLALEGGLTFDPTQSLFFANPNNIASPPLGTLLNAVGNNTWAGIIHMTTSAALDANAGTTLTVSGLLSDPDSSTVLFMTGAGTVVLSGKNKNFGGFTMVEAGTLALDNAEAVGPVNMGMTVKAGATLELEGFQYKEKPVTLDGGTMLIANGINSWSGPIVLGDNSTIVSEANTSLTDGVQVINHAETLTVDTIGNSTIAFGTTIAGAGGVVKDGTGTLIYGGGTPNTYTGPTTVNQGTLDLEKSAAVVAIAHSIDPITGLSVPATITIAAGATLAGTGTIQADVTSYGTLNVQALNAYTNANTLTIEGSLTNYGVVNLPSSGNVGTLAIDMFNNTDGTFTQAAPTAQQPGGVLNLWLSSKTCDEVKVAGQANLGGTLNVKIMSGADPSPGTNYSVLSWGTLAGNFDTINLPPSGNGIVWQWHFDNAAHELMIEAVAAVSKT
jgi:fibronectin-binding autotransporter adhesin